MLLEILIKIDKRQGDLLVQMIISGNRLKTYRYQKNFRSIPEFQFDQRKLAELQELEWGGNCITHNLI